MVRLEADLGVALFARHGRTVSLTPAGHTFLASTQRALAEVERAAESVRADADPAAGKVAFGFLHTLGSETVLLRAFRVDHPRVRFQLVQNCGEAMLERLRAGDLDLCLTSPVPDAPDLVARRLDEQKLRLVVPDDHRLAHRKRVRLAKASGELFVTLEPGYGLRRITDAVCAEAGFTPKIAFEGDAARPGGGRPRRGAAPAARGAEARRGGADGDGAARGPRDRLGLARRAPGHATGDRLQALPAEPPRPTPAPLTVADAGPADGRPVGVPCRANR